MTDHLWKRWAAEATPAQVIRQKWHETQWNLQVGDLVLVHDSSKMRNKYVLAVNRIHNRANMFIAQQLR